MKRNAIVRIILWSIVLLVLLVLFFALLYVPGGNFLNRENTPEATMVPLARPKVESIDYASGNAITKSNVNVRSAPDTGAEVIALAEEGTILNILRTETIGSNQWGYIGAPTKGWISMKYVDLLKDADKSEVATEGPSLPSDSPYNAVITADAVNLRTAPSSESSVAGMLHKGDSLLISRQELVDNVYWGYTPAPINGWVVMEYVQLQEPVDTEITEMETTSSQEQEITGYGVALDAASIRDMEIEWAAGSIRILPKDITEIRISEQGVNQSEKPMVWKVRDGKLSIQYAENKKISLGIGTQWDDIVKDLTIEVPQNWQCDSLEVTAAAASLEVKELTIREMEFDGASGSCVFDSCTVETLDLDTASGNVRFTGSLQQLECDAASADIVLELTNVPRSLDMDTASGDLDLTLPADAGFTVTLDTLSGDFESDFETTMRAGSYVAGNGRCRIDVDAMSGDVTIRKSIK